MLLAGAQGTMVPWASLHSSVVSRCPYNDGVEAFEATAAVQINLKSVSVVK